MAGQRGSMRASLPDVRQTRVDWQYVAARLSKEPGEWLVLRDISTGMAGKAKASPPAPLARLGGRLEVHMRNTYTKPGSKTRRGDLWLRWTESGTKPLVEHINEED